MQLRDYAESGAKLHVRLLLPLYRPPSTDIQDVHWDGVDQQSCHAEHAGKSTIQFT